MIKSKKGFEMAISTLVLLILGIAVLIGLILFFRKGLGDFDKGTKPFLENSEAVIAKKNCEAACIAENKFIFCCKNYTVNNQQILCNDSRFELDCSALSCDGFAC